MYIRDGLHSGLLAYIVGFCMLVAVILIAAVHSSTITNTLDTISVPPIGTCVVLVAVTALILIGGFRRLVQVTDKMVPFMTLFYLICSLIVIGANLGNVGSVISSILRCRKNRWNLAWCAFLSFPHRDGTYRLCESE